MKNPFVELIATLALLVTILLAGSFWLKYRTPPEPLQLSVKEITVVQEKKTFEQAVKETR